jgi:hypothetical protein
MHPDAPDSGQVWAGYPRVDYAPYFLTQASDDSYAHELDTPGVILNVEPEGHDVGDPDVIHPSPMPGALTFPNTDTSAHSLDRGAQLLQIYADPSERAEDERPVTARWEQDAIERVSDTALKRGTNSLPENNPDGYRLGWSVKRFYHRWLPHEYQKHTERAIHPYDTTASAAVKSPAFTAEQSNRYTSPFAWTSFYGTRNMQFPIMRRQPPDAFAVDQGNDGTDEVSEVPADWVIG